MAGFFKSDLNNLFYDSNRKAIDDAVKAVENRYESSSNSVYERIGKDGYDAVEGYLSTLRDIKTLLDVIKMYSASRHHFEKYHAANEDAFDHGDHYLGTQCVNCEYTRSQQRAVDDYLLENGRATEE
jgi:hypothetical protein